MGKKRNYSNFSAQSSGASFEQSPASNIFSSLGSSRNSQSSNRKRFRVSGSFGSSVSPASASISPQEGALAHSTNMNTYFSEIPESAFCDLKINEDGASSDESLAADQPEEGCESLTPHKYFNRPALHRRYKHKSSKKIASTLASSRSQLLDEDYDIDTLFNLNEAYFASSSQNRAPQMNPGSLQTSTTKEADESNTDNETAMETAKTLLNEEVTEKLSPEEYSKSFLKVFPSLSSGDDLSPNWLDNFSTNTKKRSDNVTSLNDKISQEFLLKKLLEDLSSNPLQQCHNYQLIDKNKNSNQDQFSPYMSTTEKNLNFFYEKNFEDVPSPSYKNNTAFLQNPNGSPTNVIENEAALEKILLEAFPSTSPCKDQLKSKSKPQSDDELSTGSSKDFAESDKILRAGLNAITRDKSLIYDGSPIVEVMRSDQKKELLKDRIAIVLRMHEESCKNNQDFSLMVTNNSWRNCAYKDGRLQLKPKEDISFSRLRFSNNSSRSSTILYLLKKCYDLLLNDCICTQREIFYQVKNAVKSQSYISEAMNIISLLLDIEPWHFPIVATSKGLVFGNLTLVTHEGQEISCNHYGGTLIPQDVTQILEFRSNAFFILVVEKDAIFKKLLDENIPNKLTRPFIIITGKGFPDLNTRLFLKRLWIRLKIPAFILVDADPFGVDIMLTYRFGSLNMVHLSEHLAIPTIRWIGIFPSEIKSLNITRQPLTERELKKVGAMLRRPYIPENPWLQRELQDMTANNHKAEIEGVIKVNHFLTNTYLPHKFHNKNYY